MARADRFFRYSPMPGSDYIANVCHVIRYRSVQLRHTRLLCITKAIHLINLMCTAVLNKPCMK